MAILNYSFQEIVFVVISLLIAFTIHELAHAYVAYKFGDDTAARQGRLTLNPLAHIDPIGAFFILIFGFGWAKPVPVNRSRFKKPRLASISTTAAGPISNFLLALLAMFIINILYVTNMFNVMPGFYADGLFTFFSIFVQYNILLGVFNLIPLPPLDGYRILEELAPRNIRLKMQSIEAYGFIIFLVLFVTPLGDYTIYPIMREGMSQMYSILTSIANIIL